MEALFNFDRLIEKPKISKFEDKRIFKKAALLFDFDPKTDFKGFKKKDIELLKDNAIARNNNRFTLSEELITKIITDEIGLDHLTDEINKNEIKSEFSRTLIKAFQSEEVVLKEFSDSELFYLTKIAGIIKNKLNLEDIKNELQRRYFFSAFKKFVQNFAGREKELSQIREYIDWLPKEGLLNKSISIIRTTINWYDKPPLLIQGVGGIGKSALISKFIVDHNNEKDGKRLPFVYIDFDIPGFSIKEPLSILLESFRQLSLQFSAQQNIFLEISKTVSDMIDNGNNTENQIIQTSNKSSRSVVYSSVEQLIGRYSWGLDKISTPILIVFDSFEEMQYRASRDELNSFFSFVKEISEKIPRIRPVFVGRSEISERLGDFKFDKIELPDFDSVSAGILLGKFGIEDKNTQDAIYDSLGGNPLILLLASDLVKKDKEAIKDFNNIREKKHEYLINRILDQIHNPDVRQIAVPGMLVRKINPEVIRKVLAGPCKLGEITRSKAKEIYFELCKEVALISKSFDNTEIMFRQDLRMTCEKMILEKYPEEAAMIRQNAIALYSLSRSEDEADEAEYYYHVLKKGEIPTELTKQVYDRIRNKLEASVIELPEKAQLYINTLLSMKISDSIIKNSSIVEWERYYLSQIKKALNNELGFMQQIFKEISQRTDRSDDPFSVFPVFEALLCQRLIKLDKSNKVINQALDLRNTRNQNNSTSAELTFIKIINLEYNGKFEEALSSCEQTLRLQNYPLNGNLSNKTNFLYKRLLSRCRKPSNFPQIELPEFSFASENEFSDIHWNFLFKGSINYEFIEGKRFESIYNIYLENLNNYQNLEQYSKQNLGVFLKDLALPGEFEIVLMDFLHILELRGKLGEIVVS